MSGTRFTALFLIGLLITSIAIGVRIEIDQYQRISMLEKQIKTMKTVALIDSLQFHYIATKTNLAECGFYLIEKSTPKRDWLMKSRLTRLLNAYEYQDSLTMAMLNKIMEE